MAKTKLIESSVRDFLAAHLDMIEPGLELVKKEKYLKSDKGASGFIDIFARDLKGQLVIIEIKINDGAARQAIHELSKYATLVKKNLLIKSTEYRLVVLSTTWHELLESFSEFFHSTRYQCEGGEILLDPNGVPSSIKKVHPLPPTPTRRLSRRHFIWEFSTRQRATAAIKKLKKYFPQIGIKDFILLLIKVQAPEFGITFLVYFAQQEERFEFYADIIRKRFSTEAASEFFEYLDEHVLEPSDKLGEAADKAWEDTGEDDGPFHLIGPDGSQISHPEKAQYWLNPEHGDVVKVFRMGRFADATLSDEKLIEELQGFGGESDYFAKITANTSNRAEVDALLQSSDNLFFFNPTWKASIREIVAYALATGAQTIQFDAFSNDDALGMLSGIAIGDRGQVPGFVLKLQKGKDTESFFGGCEWNGICPDFIALFKKYFDGDSFAYFTYRHFGENRSLNEDIMNELGLRYTVKYQQPSDNEITYDRIRIQGSSVVEVRGPAVQEIGEILSCQQFISSLMDIFIAHDQEYNEKLAMPPKVKT